MNLYTDNLVKIIKNGGIGILPTDTVYGIVCSAFLPLSVEKLYEVRKRNKQKKCIVLINDLKDLDKFEVKLDEPSLKVLNTLWPGQFSIELSVSSDKFEYLHKGTNRLSFRVPNNVELKDFLYKTGPIIAPSANPEGETTAKTIEEAKNYFPELDFYVDVGKIENLPSTVISIENGRVKIWRQGQGQVPEEFL